MEEPELARIKKVIDGLDKVESSCPNGKQLMDNLKKGFEAVGF